MSHDYDFMDTVVTDVIHLCDKKLSYYPGGVTEFKQKKPEVKLPEATSLAGACLACRFRGLRFRV